MSSDDRRVNPPLAYISVAVGGVEWDASPFLVKPMNRPIERRQSERRAEEPVSPEFLRVLEICGGELREGDRAVLGGGTGEARGAGDRRKSGGTAADRAGPAGPAPKSRGFTS